MSKYLDRAKELRAQTEPRINCAQAVILPFIQDAGVDERTAMALFSNFGGGLKRAAACGAITAGIAVLGLYGVDDPASIGEYYRLLRERHENNLECADLLKASAARGIPKKTHCDGLVFECVQLVEEILESRGKLPR